CHFGLNLPDSAAVGGNLTKLNDWAQALAKRAAILVANSGYGYGDDVTVAYSEKLMSQFAKNMDGTRSVGEAFRDAKQSYYLSNFGTYGPYDMKALQEAIFYGLPMFTTGVAGAPQAPQTTPPSTTLAPDSTGLPAMAFDSGTINAQPTQTPDGTYYSVGGNTLTKDRRPIVPQVEYDVSNTDPVYPAS